MCNKHWTSLFSEGLKNIFDNCPLVPNRKQTNKDGDSFGDECDNCPSTSNSDQVNENDFSRGVQFQTSCCPSPPFFLSSSLFSCLPTSTLPPPSSCTICPLPFPSITSFVLLFLPSTRVFPSPPTPTLFQRPRLLDPTSSFSSSSSSSSSSSFLPFYHLPSSPSPLTS